LILCLVEPLLKVFIVALMVSLDGRKSVQHMITFCSYYTVHIVCGKHLKMVK